MIVIPFFLIVLDISIIGIIVHIPHIFILILFILSTLHIVPLEVISQRRVLIIGDALELPIGVETEYQCKEVVRKTDDRYRVDVFLLV